LINAIQLGKKFRSSALLILTLKKKSLKLFKITLLEKVLRMQGRGLKLKRRKVKMIKFVKNWPILLLENAQSAH